MNTPNETRTARPQFWLRAIEHRKHAMTKQYRRSLGDTAREGISDEDYATTMATLEQMARNLGWTEEEQAEHDEHRRHFAPRFGRRGHGHGERHGHADHHDHAADHGPADHHGHDHTPADHDSDAGETPFPTPRTEA